MAQRYEITDLVFTTSLQGSDVHMLAGRSNLATGLTVTVKSLIGGNLTIYQAETGGSTFANPLTSDANTGRIEGWVEAPDFDLAITGSGFTAYTQKIRTTPGGTFNVKSYGATGLGIIDDTASIQAAIDACSALGGGIVYFPVGTYKLLGSLSRPLDVQVTLLGAGEHVSVLSWPNDLGAGTYGVNWSGGWNATRQQTRDLKFRGPSGTVALGGVPSLMRAFKIQRNTTWERVNSQGWHSAGEVVGDHIRMYNCTFGASYYALYWGEHITAGDVHLKDVSLDGALFANVGISGTNAIEGGVFQGCHFGFAPFCIYKETPSTKDEITIGSYFNQCAFEAVGNAVIEDQALSGKVYGTFFEDCAGSYDVNYNLASAFDDYMVHVGTIDGLIINSHGRDSSFMSWRKTDGGFFYCANDLRNLRWQGAGQALLNAKSAVLPLFSGVSALDNNMLAQGNSVYVLRRIDSGAASVEAGDLLKRFGTYNAQKNSGAGSDPVGWAWQDAAVNVIVPVQISGEVTGRCTTAIGADKLVRPDDANAGKVKEATGWSDVPVLGFTQAGAGVSSNVNLFPKLGFGAVP